MNERLVTLRVAIAFIVATAIVVWVDANIGGCQWGNRHCANVLWDENGGLVVLLGMLFQFGCAWFAI